VTIATPIVSGPWGSEGSLDDEGYLLQVRERLDDWPVPKQIQFTPTGNSTLFKSPAIKMNDDAYFAVTINGVVQQTVSRRADLTSSNAYVDYNTGSVLFGTPPQADPNSVVIQMNQVRWRDSKILSLLYEGLQSLFPKMFREGVYSGIQMAVNTWDYVLPPDFADPGVRVISYGMREIPSTTNRFRPMNTAYVVHGNPPLLRIPPSQYFSPGATLEIRYTAPYRNLSDVDGRATALPILYACAMLLGFEESKRTIAAGQTTTTDTSAQPVQYQQNAGSWYMAQYRALLANLVRPMGGLAPISTYAR
jgi:hypothetical protein